MYLQYGAVSLTVIDLTRFERETVWTEDGADLEAIDTTIGVTATYAPGGVPRMPSSTIRSENTVATLTGEDNTAAVLARQPRGAAPGVTKKINPVPLLESNLAGDDRAAPALHRSGPETDTELRAHLWLPRKKLILWAYDRQTGQPIRWVESPRPGFTTDVENGPKPISVDVVASSGEPNSVVVHFQVATRMSPCPIGSDRLVLSHRWEMTHGADENYYLTRTIRGIIRFNGAVMRAQSVNPDFIRAQFIHPIPIGFQRRIPPDGVTQSSDGLTIRYTVIDFDPTITFDPGASGATMMQIVERMQTRVDTGIN